VLVVVVQDLLHLLVSAQALLDACQLSIRFAVIAQDVLEDLVLELQFHRGFFLAFRLFGLGEILPDVFFRPAEVQIGGDCQNHRDHHEQDECDLQPLTFTRCHDSFSFGR